MTRPEWTTDPIEWAVFADWCHDHDLAEEETRARQITRALAAYPAGLWLCFQSVGGERAYLSGAHNRIQDNIEQSYWGNPPEYSWQTGPVEESYSKTPLTPLCMPRSFSTPTGQKLTASFWDTLVELGKEAE